MLAGCFVITLSPVFICNSEEFFNIFIVGADGIPSPIISDKGRACSSEYAAVGPFL